MGTNVPGTPGTSATADGQDADVTLTAEIRRVLSRIDAHAAGGGQADAPQPDGTGSASPAPLAAPGTAPLDALVGCFGLTAFERDVILLTAADELDPTTAAR